MRYLAIFAQEYITIHEIASHGTTNVLDSFGIVHHGMYNRFHRRCPHEGTIVLNDTDVGRVDALPKRVAKGKAISMSSR